MAERIRLTFHSGGVDCVGYLYCPAGTPGTGPCVVMAHGFSGTQEGALAATAADFAAAGIAAFTFDYRNFGESGGQPRQVISIRGQHEDLQQAIAFVQSLPQVDPEKVALWGSSLGGGHVIAVAADVPGLAAVIAQVPFTFGFPSRVEGRRPADARRLLGAAIADWRRGRTGQPPRYIAVVGLPGELAVMATADALETTLMMDNNTWRNEVAPRVLLDMAFWSRPGRRAKDVTCPILFSLAENDREGPIAIALRAAAIAPFGETRRYPCTHFEFYHPAVRRVVVADQISFLRTHLIGFAH